MLNSLNWRDGHFISTFIVGSKYCTVGHAYTYPAEIMDAVLAWHMDVDPQGPKVPFVVLSSVYVQQNILDWYAENELLQVQVNI